MNDRAGDVSREKLVQDLRLVIADAEDLLKATAANAGEKVAAARERIQDRIFSGGLEGAGLLTVGRIEGDDELVTVAGRSYCGGLCAHWMTLVVRNRPDGWTVTGTTGPIAIS